jgi:hypothetical protein
MKQALYFGFIESHGHGLVGTDGWRTLQPDRVPAFPWRGWLIDTGLLKNGKVPDQPDGRVFWTCGGDPLWQAFVWWDRSGDSRGASNSGFYVQGFSHLEREAAFAFACAAFPQIVARQRRPLVLQSDAVATDS